MKWKELSFDNSEIEIQVFGKYDSKGNLNIEFE